MYTTMIQRVICKHLNRLLTIKYRRKLKRVRRYKELNVDYCEHCQEYIDKNLEDPMLYRVCPYCYKELPI